MPHPSRPLTVIAAGAACISAAPVLVKAQVLGGLGPTAVAFWRCALGAGILAAIAVVRRTDVRMGTRGRALAVLAGFLFCVDLHVWHRSIDLAGAGMATILGNTQVFWTALLGIVLFGEHIGPRFVLAAGAAVVGIGLLLGVGSQVDFTPAYVEGIVFGLLTGVAYSAFLSTMRAAGRAQPSPAPEAVMLWMTTAAAVFLGGLTLVVEGPSAPVSVAVWGQALALALVAQSLGWLAISGALPRVPAASAALILLLQPVLATVWGALLFGEQLRALQLVGAALTLAAIYAGSMRPGGRGTGVEACSGDSAHKAVKPRGT